MQLGQILELLKLVPNLGAVLSLIKSLPFVLDQLEKALKDIEAGIKSAGAAGGVDVTAATSALEKAVALLDTAKKFLAPFAG